MYPFPLISVVYKSERLVKHCSKGKMCKSVHINLNDMKNAIIIAKLGYKAYNILRLLEIASN